VEPTIDHTRAAGLTTSPGADAFFVGRGVLAWPLGSKVASGGVPRSTNEVESCDESVVSDNVLNSNGCALRCPASTSIRPLTVIS